MSPYTAPQAMRDALRELIALLRIEQLEHNLFRGTSGDMGSQNVFGGQVLGQALVAAARTVEGAGVHSLHGYFLRPGDKKAPIVYDVDRIRDGASFVTRRVVAIQHGRPIFHMSASFQRPEEGIEHQAEMPEVAPPESLPTEAELRQGFLHRLPEALQAFYLRERPVDLRPLDPLDPVEPEARPPRADYWMRAAERLPDEPVLHQALLAYASDYQLLRCAMQPHRLAFQRPGVQIASLDHAMWFHRDFRFDDWLLYATDAPSASHARGFCRGSLYTRDGRLIASVAQEGLIRVHPAGAGAG